MLFFTSKPAASSLDPPPVPRWRRLFGCASPSGETLELLRIVREERAPATRVAAISRMADVIPEDRPLIARALIALLQNSDPSVQGAADHSLSELLTPGKMRDRTRRRCINELRALSDEGRLGRKLLLWVRIDSVLRKVDKPRLSDAPHMSN